MRVYIRIVMVVVLE